ncbi:hypothetical protein HYPSUDRAFT_979693 [Hypholoma sublateritium FD-334 SS-4]|uniref:Uncharacterized protein n=1 Tax=Hypholoma sublateritium (strain FD-334 SS-4) TaxID=945553 RepID=A0A0D2Q5Z4_HYPSF|nr:hypothetical protein HYPSUDRAFT_979693 [Hypholoma sublateritium FD-334 SS-4]
MAPDFLGGPLYEPETLCGTSESSPHNTIPSDPFKVQLNLSALGIHDHEQWGYDIWSEWNTEYSPFETEVPKSDIATLCYEFAHTSPPLKLSKSQCYEEIIHSDSVLRASTVRRRASLPLLLHLEEKPADAACLPHVSQIPLSLSPLLYGIWRRPTRTRRLILTYLDLGRTYLPQTGPQDISSLCDTFGSCSTVWGSGSTLYSEKDWDSAKIHSAFLGDITVPTPPVMPPPPPLPFIMDALDFIPLLEPPDISFGWSKYLPCAQDKGPREQHVSLLTAMPAYTLIPYQDVVMTYSCLLQYISTVVAVGAHASFPASYSKPLPP